MDSEKRLQLNTIGLWVCLLILFTMLIWLVVKTTKRIEQNREEGPSHKYEEMQDGTFFKDGEERFIKVDDGSMCGYPATVYADSITGVMYIFVGPSGSLSPLYNSDGTLMIYDVNPPPMEVIINVEKNIE